MIGKITMNELSEPLRQYLQKLSGDGLTINNLALEVTDDINYKGVCAKGKTINSVKLNWDLNKTSGIKSCTISMTDLNNPYNPIIIVDGLTDPTSGDIALEKTYTINELNNDVLSLKTDYKFTISIEYYLSENTVPVTVSKDVYLLFRDPIFFGKCEYTGTDFSDTTNPEHNGLSELKFYLNNGQLKELYTDDKNISFSVNTQQNQYITFLLSAEELNLTNNIFYINSLRGGMSDSIQQFRYTRPDNTTVLYNIFRSNNPYLGNCKIDVKDPIGTEGLIE